MRTAVKDARADETVTIERIVAREARIGVVGMGYVGLPFAVEKAKVGFHVLGFEGNPNLI